MAQLKNYVIYRVINGEKGYHTINGNHYLLYKDKYDERYIKTYTKEEVDEFLLKNNKMDLLENVKIDWKVDTL